MKLSSDQMSLAELRELKVGDRLILHWQTNPNTIHHLEGAVSQIDRDTFRVKYLRENNPNWETAFFWNWLDSDGTSRSEYFWSFTKL